MTKKTDKNLPLVVIFGRTNVGKSTLFNCLIEKKQALVSTIEGTTRDSNINDVEWQGRKFKLVDTGGIMDIDHLGRKVKKSETIDERVQQKVRSYLQESDLILFLTDAKQGLMKQDKEMAMYLKKRFPEEKLMLVANKVDAPKYRANSAEFNKLSLNEPLTISAATGSGTGDMLDEIVKKLKIRKSRKKLKETKEEKPIRVCLVGKPNVGKSSLLNKILGYERVIVSNIAHTTREPQNTEIEYKDKKIELIDTAGISKKGQKTKGLEKYGIEKSLIALKKSDIALLLIDIKEGITHQDAKIVEEIVERGTSFITLANKWDLIEEKDTKKYTKYIRGKFPFAMWSPIHFASALTGSKVDKILNLVLEISEKRKIEISDSRLQHFLKGIIKIHRPAKAKGTKRPHIFEIKQLHANPPRFSVRIGAKDTLHFSYVRFIENRLREKFDIKGTPIKIEVIKNKRIHGKAEEISKDNL